MTIVVVPDGRGAWQFHGAAAVDGHVRGRVTRNAADAIFNLLGGGLRYLLAPISGGSDAPIPDGGGRVLGEEMAPDSPRRSERHGHAVALLVRARS